MLLNIKIFKSSIQIFESWFRCNDVIIRKKVKANEEAMKALAEKRKQEKKNNLRHHYEHLCATQMEKRFFYILFII